jgi:hypothetical protein
MCGRPGEFPSLDLAAWRKPHTAENEQAQDRPSRHGAPLNRRTGTRMTHRCIPWVARTSMPPRRQRSPTRSDSSGPACVLRNDRCGPGPAGIRRFSELPVFRTGGTDGSMNWTLVGLLIGHGKRTPPWSRGSPERCVGKPEIPLTDGGRNFRYQGMRWEGPSMSESPSRGTSFKRR